MLTKNRKFFGSACFLLFCLTVVPALAAEKVSPWTASMQGRLLYFSRPGTRPEFLVVAGAEKNGAVPCRRPGGKQIFQVHRTEVKLLPFSEDVSALTATQYALYAYSHDRPNGWEVMLAKKTGDTTGRMGILAEYEIARNAFLTKLKAIPKGEDPEDFADAAGDLLLDGNPVSEILRKALGGDDRILAIALLESYRRTLADNQKLFSATDELNQLCKSEFDTLTKEFLDNFITFKQRSNARQERFRRLFPRARGLWCESPPTDYQGLFRIFERSLGAFARLDELSSITEPEEWGSAMLDSLLLTEGSLAGEELETEFDSAMSEIEKRMSTK